MVATFTLENLRVIVGTLFHLSVDLTVTISYARFV